MPEIALQILRFHFQIGNRGFQLGVPVDQPLVAVDQPVLVQIDEGFQHGLAEMLVHRELLAAPVHGAAQAAKLGGDRAARFLFPFPDLLHEVLTGIIGALVLAGFQLAFHHHLRGDACMVRTHNPQRILAAHAFIPDHDILKCVVQRVADMKATRHIRWRVHNRIGFCTGTLRPEQAVFLPMGIPAGLDRGGVECGGELGFHKVCGFASGTRRNQANWLLLRANGCKNSCRMRLLSS